MKKKLLSLVMACAMILSLAVPAFAGYFDNNGEAVSSLSPDGIVFAAKIHVPTVKLTMPSIPASGNPVVLNPYKLTYSGGDLKVNDVAVGSNEDQVKQVISPVYAIKNETDVALKFAVKATTELNSSAEFTFSTSHVGLAEKTKKAFIQLVIKKTAETSAMPTAASTTQNLDPFDTANYESVVLAVGEKTTQAAQLKKLAAVTSGQNYLVFQFQGSMTRTPDTGWITDDTFTTTLEFTFTPEGNQDYNATAVLTTGSATQALGAALSGTAPSIAVDVDSSATTGKYTAVTAPSASAASAAVTLANNKISDLVSTTAAGWTMISGGAYGATIDASTGVITYPLDAGKTLASGANTDGLIIGFNDVNGVPKTMGITVTITHTVAT